MVGAVAALDRPKIGAEGAEDMTLTEKLTAKQIELAQRNPEGWTWEGALGLGLVASGCIALGIFLGFLFWGL